ncbi:MAG: 3-deoxy-manno-octulosonate-8-phosphatase KdsC [Gammaproteobacteria bacterium]|nr:3-deoxy-manno-octulosonate-8-phosphatase KdsC [Gammaproteobacteria bacterium]
MDEISLKAKNTQLVIFDIDGVLTTGALFMDNQGEEYKAFNSKDGHGIRMLIECGVDVAIITGRQSELVKHRMKDLGITTIYQGYRDKRPAFQELLKAKNIAAENIAYVGDDVIDLPVMTQVGFSVAVADAHPFVIKHADYTTKARGGCAAGREIIELILEEKGLLEEKLNSYLS